MGCSIKINPVHTLMPLFAQRSAQEFLLPTIYTLNNATIYSVGYIKFGCYFLSLSFFAVVSSQGFTGTFNCRVPKTESPTLFSTLCLD